MASPLDRPLTRRGALGLTGGAAGALLLGVTPEADAAAGWRTLVVVSANVGRKHPARREPAIRAVRGAAKRPLVGFQEIGEGDGDAREAAWIREYFGSSFTKVFNGPSRGGPSYRVPLAVPGWLEVKQPHATFVHKGKSDVTPPRYINEAVLKGPGDDRPIKFAFLNTHYVAGAWNGRQDSWERWRRRQWQHHFDVHRARVAAYHQQNLPVIWTGDVNRGEMPRLHRLEKRAFARGIDQIRWIPGDNGTQIRLVDTRTVNMSVDSHDARVAVFQIRRR